MKLKLLRLFLNFTVCLLVFTLAYTAVNFNSWSSLQTQFLNIAKNMIIIFTIQSCIMEFLINKHIKNLLASSTSSGLLGCILVMVYFILVSGGSFSLNASQLKPLIVNFLSFFVIGYISKYCYKKLTNN